MNHAVNHSRINQPDKCHGGAEVSLPEWASAALDEASRGHKKAFAADSNISWTRFETLCKQPTPANPIARTNQLLRTAQSIDPERLAVLIEPLLDGIPIRLVDELTPEPADANRVIAECADVIAVVSRAIRDGHLTSDERAAILKEGKEAERTIGGLLAAIGGER